MSLHFERRKPLAAASSVLAPANLRRDAEPRFSEIEKLKYAMKLSEQEKSEDNVPLLRKVEKRINRKLAESEIRELFLAKGVEEHRITTNGMDIFYLEAGKKNDRTVLLVHGGGNSTAYEEWRYQMLELAEKYHVIAPDLPGYGHTKKPGKKGTLNFYVNEFMGNFAEALKIDKVSVVGCSMGGGIAIGYALNNTAHVEKLALINSFGIYGDAKLPIWVRSLTVFPRATKIGLNVLSRNENVVKGVLNGITGGKNIDEKDVHETSQFFSKDGVSLAFIEFLHEQLEASPRLLLSDLLKQEFGHKAILRGFYTVYTDRLTELNKYGVEVLLMHGREDPLLPVSAAKQAAERLDKCRFVSFDCGHSPQTEKPEQLNDELLSFLEGSKNTDSNSHKHNAIIEGIKSVLRKAS